MRKIFVGFLLTFFAVFCMGASFESLSEDDQGQLIYDTWHKKVLVYQKNASGKKWHCTLFRGDGSCNAVPANCVLLNAFEDDLQPEAIAMELAYWTAKNNRNLSDGYGKVAQRLNHPSTNKLLLFYSELSKLYYSLKRDVAEYEKAVAQAKQKKEQGSGKKTFGCPMNNSQQKSEDDDIDELCDKILMSSVQDSPPLKMIREMYGKEQNFFVAFCMYYSYRKMLLQGFSIRSPEIRNDMIKEVTQQGEDVLKQFLLNRKNNQNRENNFKKICRDKFGRWGFAPPANLQDMGNSVTSCYKAYRKTQSLSSFSEFPDWGNAMLEVLQMMQNKKWEQQFDRAYSEYQKIR